MADVDKVYIVKCDKSFDCYDDCNIVFVSFNKDDAIKFIIKGVKETTKSLVSWRN